MERIRQLDEEIASTTAALLDSVAVQPREVSMAAPELASDHDIFQTLWTLKAGFQQVDSLIAQDNFLAALTSLKELDQQLASLAAKYPTSLLVIDCDRQRNERKTAISAHVEKLWLASVSFVDNNTLKCVSSVSKDLVEVVDAHFLHFETELIERINKVFIEPLLKRQITVSSKQDGDFTILKAVDETSDNIPALLASVKQLVNGLHNTFIGPRVSQRYSRSFTDGLIRRTIPEMLSFGAKLGKDEFDSVLEELRDVDTVFESAGWARGHTFEDLSRDFRFAWTRSLESHYLDQLRSLLKGELVLSDVPAMPAEAPTNSEWDWNSDDEDQEPAPKPSSTLQTGDPDVLVTSIIATRDGLASEVPDEQALVLYAELFRALAPQYYGKHELLLYYHASKLAETRNKDTPAMERFAQHQLGSALQTYADEIGATITRLNILPGALPNTAAAAEVKEAVANIAEDVAQQSGFSVDMRETVLSSVVEQIAAEVIGAVEALPVIGESQSQQISLSIAHLHGLSAYFVNVEEAVPSWVKLQSLQKLLTANLASIRQMLADGQLIDFGGDELTALINALFEESVNRRDLVRDVRATLG